MSQFERLRPGRRRWTEWTCGCLRQVPMFALLSVIILSCSCSPVLAVDRSQFAENSVVTRWDAIIADRRYPREVWDSPSDTNNPNETIDLDALIADSDNGDGWTPTLVKRSSSSSSTTTASSASAFPTAFESLGNNFTTTSCPQFFTEFLSNSTFKSCYAISLLLENSNSFFQVLGSAASLDQVVETSCTADVNACTSYLSQLASDLIRDSACGQDYNLGNPNVVQAHTGMIAYEPIRRATCLKDPATEEFCFTEAATNVTNVTDYYVYFLPLGMPLPGSSRPTCNKCLQATMQVFQQSALIKGQPLTQTYIPAAQRINLGCGPGFVNSTVKVGSETAVYSGSILARGNPPTVTLFLRYGILSSIALWIL